MEWPAKLYSRACCMNRTLSAKLILIEGSGLDLWELAIPIGLGLDVSTYPEALNEGSILTMYVHTCMSVTLANVDHAYEWNHT